MHKLDEKRTSVTSTAEKRPTSEPKFAVIYKPLTRLVTVKLGEQL